MCLATSSKVNCFFDNTPTIARYDRNKHPWIEKLTERQLGFFWRPEEVNLSKDKGDFQSLTEHEKFIFTKNLGYQILLDSVQSRGISNLLENCSNQEVELFSKTWEFFETLHSYSYTYIIKNIYSDPGDIFDTILDDERILERAKSVTAAYDEFLQAAQEYGNSNDWKFAQEGVPTAQESLYELKRKLYKAIANVNILEGIRFYVSFACSFAFGELKLMEGSAKIISLIARDESQHLVLTQKILRRKKTMSSVLISNTPLP